MAVLAAMAVGMLVLVGLGSGTATAATTAVSHDQQLATARAYAEGANPGASVVFAGVQIVKPGVVDQYDFVFMVDGTTRYAVSLKSNGSLGWKSTVPNCLIPVPCDTLPVEKWVSSPSEAITAIASTDARFAGGVSSVVYGKNAEPTAVPREPHLLRDVHDGRLHGCPHLAVRPRQPAGRPSLLIQAAEGATKPVVPSRIAA